MTQGLQFWRHHSGHEGSGKAVAHPSEGVEEAGHGGHVCLLTHPLDLGPQVGDAQAGRPATDLMPDTERSPGICLGSG